MSFPLICISVQPLTGQYSVLVVEALRGIGHVALHVRTWCQAEAIMTLWLTHRGCGIEQTCSFMADPRFKFSKPKSTSLSSPFTRGSGLGIMSSSFPIKTFALHQGAIVQRKTSIRPLDMSSFSLSLYQLPLRYVRFKAFERPTRHAPQTTRGP